MGANEKEQTGKTQATRCCVLLQCPPFAAPVPPLQPGFHPYSFLVFEFLFLYWSHIWWCEDLWDFYACDLPHFKNSVPFKYHLVCSQQKTTLPKLSLYFWLFLARPSLYFLPNSPKAVSSWHCFSFSLPLIHPGNHPSSSNMLAIRLLTGETSAAPSCLSVCGAKGQSECSCSRRATWIQNPRRPFSYPITRHSASVEGKEVGHNFLYEVITPLPLLLLRAHPPAIYAFHPFTIFISAPLKIIGVSLQNKCWGRGNRSWSLPLSSTHEEDGEYRHML